MAEILHPAARAEQLHLSETLNVIAYEKIVAREDRESAEQKLAEARRFDPDALPLREMLYARAVETMQNLDKAQIKPYFTRVDFTENNGTKEVYYIGKYGVLRTDTLESQVIDWRAPVANLYYSGQIGPIKYSAPDGDVEGELTLKRQFGIEDSELKTIFDTDLVSQDEYLQSVLGQMTGDKLKDVVTTIQAEQNFVIRYPLRQNLVVQGVAGSGKTTIALHRIAYLLYSFWKQLRPEHMLILAPNPLFLNFIAGVLPDLGVDQVIQQTYEGWITEYLEGRVPKISTADRMDTVSEMDYDTLGRVTRVAQAKGSLRMEALVDEWMDRYEDKFVPEQGLKFGPVRLYTHEEMKKFLLEDEKPFPMQRRVEEFKKQLTMRVKAAANELIQWYTSECQKRIDKIRQTVFVPAERADRVDNLQNSRDAQVKKTRAQVKVYIKNVLSELPTLDPKELYRMFWEDMLESEDADIRLAAEYTVARYAKKQPLEREDMAIYLCICLRVMEIKRRDIRHIVIDEAQDFNALEMRMLQRIHKGATFTIVGDLMQGINAWRGLHNWGVLQNDIFSGRATTHQLVTSYRNTVEIMNVAKRIAKNHPTPGQTEIKPVLRHGDEPEFISFASAKEQAQLIESKVREWRGAGMAAIAIIARTEKPLKALLKKLPGDLQAKLLDVNDPEYAGGVLLATSASVKGFEFDGVIILDASASIFPDTELDARLLYVSLTRALHKLALYHNGEITPLLK